MKKRNKCLVCNCQNLEKLFSYYSKYNKYFFSRVAICKECGHIQLFIIPSSLDYLKLNDKYFNTNYLISGDISNNNKKLNNIKNRLNPILKKGMKVLDVGAGEGWLLDFILEKGCTYHAIESVKELAASIELRGGKILGDSVFDDFPKHSKRFDIIIFRHVIEHLVEPREALHRLSGLLNKTGYLYLALPDGLMSENINRVLKKGFRTSFIRPIHISYFCRENVNRIALTSGLSPIFIKIENEIFGLFQKGETINHLDAVREFPNFYNRNKKRYIKAFRVARKKDQNAIIKNLPRDILNRIFKN